MLKRNHNGRNDVEQALREAGCDLGDMACGLLEVDGKISIRKRKPAEQEPGSSSAPT